MIALRNGPGSARRPPIAFEDIRPGMRVKFRIPAGVGRDGVEWKVIAGRVVFNEKTHLVVNIGGRHGTPKVVTRETIA